MSFSDKFTEISDPDIRDALKEWALERVRDEITMFRDALRLFVQMAFLANSVATLSVATILIEGDHLVSTPLLISLFCFLGGLLSGLVFGCVLMASLNKCREAYLMEAPRLYFMGELTHAEFADFHRETALQRFLMSLTAFLAVLAFVAGVSFAAVGAFEILSRSVPAQ